MDIQFDKYFLVLQNIATRYYLLGGLVFLLFYVVLKNKIVHKKIQLLFPKKSDYLREIGYSTLTMLMFAFIPIFFIYNPAVKIYTTLYPNMSDYGWVYYFAAFPIMFVIHDTYFYWTHRMMHHPRLFSVFHRVHHLSNNPSPWASYAFAPAEAVVEAGIFPLAVLVMPIHPLAFTLFMLWQIFFNVIGNNGYEYHPRWLMDTWLGKFLNTPTNHVMHHEKMRGNYGLYFNVWDRLMGTNHPDYESRFRTVTSRPKTEATA